MLESGIIAPRPGKSFFLGRKNIFPGLKKKTILLALIDLFRFSHSSGSS